MKKLIFFILVLLSTDLCASPKSTRWIRNFNAEENGGGHRWSNVKTQTIYKQAFRCKNWSPCSGETNCGNSEDSSSYGFSCNHTSNPSDPGCLIRNAYGSNAQDVFRSLEIAELKGVPGITEDYINQNDSSCYVDVYDQRVASNKNLSSYFNRRKIFSEGISSCIASGTTVNLLTPEEYCCSGNIINNRCALPDNTDISLYLNALISSEGSSVLPNSAFDSETGYILNQADIINLACSNKICASGVLAQGVLVSSLKIAGHENSVQYVSRFIDGNDEASNFSGLADVFDMGVRLNNHLYCVSPLFSFIETIECSSVAIGSK